MTISCELKNFFFQVVTKNKHKLISEYVATLLRNMKYVKIHVGGNTHFKCENIFDRVIPKCNIGNTKMLENVKKKNVSHGKVDL